MTSKASRQMNWPRLSPMPIQSAWTGCLPTSMPMKTAPSRLKNSFRPLAANALKDAVAALVPRDKVAHRAADAPLASEVALAAPAAMTQVVETPLVAIPLRPQVVAILFSRPNPSP